MKELPSLYQQQIHSSKYARWREEEKRRETWEETVDRYLTFMQQHIWESCGYDIEDVVEDLREAILDLEVMPSMRALMTAGPALKRDNVAGFNCSALTINRPQAFDETLYLLCCGVGVGFSVERQYVNQLPEVSQELYPSDTTIVVRDSKIGWASALRQLIHLLYSGIVPHWDMSKVRPAGSRLKTFGGRSSGPEPLAELFNYVVEIFRAAQGRKLSSIEAHGIMCKIGDIVVVGGVRRSALLSLSNPSDDRMRDAKTGQWWDLHPEYRLANNSAAWTEQPSMERFMDEWTALIKSKSGERGIFNRDGARKKVASLGRREDHEFLGNPCMEVLLRDRGLCNLSEVVVRKNDTWSDLHQKAELAAILGTFQSTLTNFRYLSQRWKTNAEEERLLGVSLTGILDNCLLAQIEDEALPAHLNALRQKVIDTNVEWAKKLGINPSVATTVVKPSGTVSQLVDAASGIHPRWSKHYVRTNRMSKNDPVAQMLFMSGVPAEDEMFSTDSTWVFSYPQRSPDTSVFRNELTAINQLRLWLIYAEHWCEHNPSCTIYVREDEWLEVGAFVYKHFDRMCGVSFLPYSDHTYKQAPYQEIDKDTYDKLVAEMPDELSWGLLQEYEKEDSTEGPRELACAAGACEVL